MKKPRDPATLPKESLARIVSILQFSLYQETDGSWDANKEVGGADLVSLLSDIMVINDLHPKDDQPSPANSD